MNYALDKQFRRFLWSSILIALSACLGNVVDGIIVGKLIGPDGVSAINLSRPVIQFIFTVTMLVAGGGGMLVGFALGRKDDAEARHLFTQTIFVNMMVALLLVLCGLFFIQGAAEFLCSNPHLLPSTKAYLQPVLLGSPVYLGFQAVSMMVSVDGSPRLTSVATIIDNAVNLSLDIVFIQLFGWGIAGSSWATVVGHVVGICILLRHWRPRGSAHVALTRQTSVMRGFTKTISQGAPLAVASICLTLLLFSANTIMLSTVGRLGLFAFAVCMNLLQIYNLFLSGSCRTMQSLGAIQVGKHDDEAFRFVLMRTFRFISVSMLITCAVVFLFTDTISGLFGATTAEEIVGCRTPLRIFALSFIPFCYIYAVMIVYKLYGYHKIALFISFALSLTVIPVLWLIAKFFPEWIWYSYLIAYIIETLAIVGIHKASHAKFELGSSRHSSL